ncbi:type IV toxin-antitoxin system AbiEi family antitoxin [Hyunsoonleella ulvae]|uniref:type IV toxin-antitoxin system AbiEi family antitoxin n=1 Tax=Hyunsoonleella ulvae TaxID=2799948 RepID=UPI001939395E|nr:type IV toxin-antitoxin system AbiEi family antitoxin [Hyunsoonleella ulvae]
MAFYKIKDWFENIDFDIQITDVRVKDRGVDAVIGINSETVYAEVKKEVRPRHVAIFEAMAEHKRPLLVAADYITPNAKMQLKESKINYLDSYGNVYVNLQHLKIYVEQGNSKPVVRNHSALLTQSGGQVIFSLLKNPELINATQRFLAHISNVSLGSVSNTIQGLVDEGFVVKWNGDQKYQLVNKDTLLERWVVTLNEKILPAYKLGMFTFSKTNKGYWRNQLKHPNVLWSGEPAAALVTEYLNPEQFSLFTHLPKAEIIKNLKLLPDSNGEITIYNPFWIESDTMERLVNYKNQQNAVHPLIIYAQLVYSGNSRNLETAQLIFNEYIEPYL